MSTIARRQPTLADRFLAPRHNSDETKSKIIIQPNTYRQVTNALRQAHRYVLDEQATKMVAKVVAEIPDLLAREHQFARAPFDLTWIEWPSWHFWMELRKLNPALYDAQGIYGDPATADGATGYLIDFNRVNMIVGARDTTNNAPELHLFQYHLNTEWPVEEQLDFARSIGASRAGIDAFLWGSSWDKLGKEERRVLRGYNKAEVIPLRHDWPHLQQDGAMTGVARGSVGEFRALIAILLMLNRPSLTQYKHTLPNARSFARGKSVQYFSHTVVTINLDPVPTLRLIGTPEGEGVTRRRHEVGRHYCHDKRARDYMRIAGCIHEWQATDKQWAPITVKVGQEPKNWVCKCCGGKRWQMDKHERGDANKGYVIREGYNVTVL